MKRRCPSDEKRQEMTTRFAEHQALDRIVDRVLAYRPKPVTTKAKKRKRKAKKHAKTA